MSGKKPPSEGGKKTSKSRSADDNEPQPGPSGSQATPGPSKPPAGAEGDLPPVKEETKQVSWVRKKIYR